MIYNGNRAERNPIGFLIILKKSDDRVAGVWFVYSQVWLQTELDDTKSSYQLIITIKMFEKTNAFIFFVKELSIPNTGRVTV